jgi:hypothetical protein
MTLSRRKTLALLGGGAIVAAAAASPSRSPARSNAHFCPGRAGQYDDPRMRALSWAILAPNPHNRQPWKVDLSVPGQARALRRSRPPAAANGPVQSPDPYRWAVFWSSAHGGASGRAGRRGRPVPRRRGSGRPRRTPRRDLPLRPTRPMRPIRSSSMPPPAQQQGTLRHVRDGPGRGAGPLRLGRHGTDVGVTVAGGGRGAARPDAAPWRSRSTRRIPSESVEVFRIGRREVDANPDGLEFHGPAFEAMRLFGLFTREAAADPDSTAFRAGTRRRRRPSTPPWPTSGP